MVRRWNCLPLVAVLAGGMLATSDVAAAQGAAPAAERGGRTRVVMLGTGVPPADPERFGAAVVVLVDSTPYLFDMGVGVVRRWTAALRSGIAPSLGASSLRTAFVTHLHSDHTLGYAELIFTSWTLEGAPRRPLDVYGPEGLQRMTDHLLAAYTEDVAVRTGPEGELAGSPPPVVRVHEVGPGVVYRDSLVTVTAFSEHHGTWAHAFGYRIQTPDRTIVLSGDTGPPSGVVDQCRGCDILLHEGGSVTDAEAGPYFRRFHVTAEELAAIARATRPRLLVLYHQRPAAPAVERAYGVLRSLYDGAFVVARDLDVYR
ncbi:MAG TPA: MBL fold metallo-hydrolase [Gemmatimonadaceae bacterium]|jgi:ribonuclease Z